MLNDWEHTTTYANEKNLRKALVKLGYDDNRVLIVRTPEGRWTAVFGLSMYGTHPAFNGFKTLS